MMNDQSRTEVQSGATLRSFTRKMPEAHVMRITPALAQAMLDSSAGNRRLRPWYVSFLTGAMKRGEWRVTSQGIGFDVRGHLRDAHHRLTACVRSGVTIESVVVLGMPENAYEVTDAGILRTYGDRLGESDRVASVIRLGVQYALGTQKPTVDQMRPFSEAGLGDAVRTLVETCGTSTRYYASAPMRLAACITVMAGGDAEYVLGQYEALCRKRYDEMSPIAQALTRLVEVGSRADLDSRIVLARGLKVFDPAYRHLKRMRISEQWMSDSADHVKAVLLESVQVANADHIPETSETVWSRKSPEPV